MTDHFHTIVIGSGSGGMTVAVGLANLGKQVAFIEGGPVGGDCTNVGCVPSKTLIHLAKNFKPGMNADEVVRQVTRKRDALRDKETEEVTHMENITFIHGWAKFSGPREVQVSMISDGSTRTLVADHIVIATGARPRELEIPGLPKERTLTNENLFDIQQAPKHLAVVGAGVIALEMAFAFQKLGTKVTMFALDERPLTVYIDEVSEAMQPEIKKKGIVTYYSATAKSFDETTRTLTLNRVTKKLKLRR